ncbi:glycyl-radical enzyme activating protein [Treponema primitia]|uniref:glycyl-radical enzyme activating protein n=1 Tax=Treponema primitia TaxID=88058 RepID=UPI000255581B|nr:glycyl-radical enzyme activating protein [Treponema primitia]
MPVKALLFNIQKFSLHDGPGIRTVVFFKGCPLRCRWCSNPESQEAGLGTVGLGGVTASNRLSADIRYYTVEEVMETCLQDRPFYEESGGGVTLSGGEVLLQAGFATALLDRLGEEKIHRAIETSALAPAAVWQECINHVDLLLIDVKHYDRERHIEGTTVSNEACLANLQTALDRGKNVLPRIPVIPGFNNSLEDAEGFARLFTAMGISKVELLPFHQFGEKKYEDLGIPYPMHGIPQLHREDLTEYRQVLIDRGIDA